MAADRAAVRAFVDELLLRKGGTPVQSDDERLITSGRMDSIDVLEIVAFLESRCGVDFAARPFDPGEFDTVAGIAAFARV